MTNITENTLGCLYSTLKSSTFYLIPLSKPSTLRSIISALWRAQPRWRHFQNSIFSLRRPTGRLDWVDIFCWLLRYASRRRRGERGRRERGELSWQDKDIHFRSSLFIRLAYTRWPEAGVRRKEERLVRTELSYLTSCGVAYTGLGPCQWTLNTTLESVQCILCTVRQFVATTGWRVTYCLCTRIWPKTYFLRIEEKGLQYHGVLRIIQYIGASQCLRQGKAIRLTLSQQLWGWRTVVGPPGVSFLLPITMGVN